MFDGIDIGSYLLWVLNLYDFLLKYEKDPARRAAVREQLPSALARGEVFLRMRKGHIAALGIARRGAHPEYLDAQYVLISPKIRSFHARTALLTELLSDALAAFPETRFLQYERRNHKVLINPSAEKRISRCPAQTKQSGEEETPRSQNSKNPFSVLSKAYAWRRSSSGSSLVQSFETLPSDSPLPSSSRSSESFPQDFAEVPSEPAEEQEDFPQTWSQLSGKM